MKEVFGTLALAAFVVAIVGIVVALPVKWLWNGCMPFIFDLPRIGFGQAFCLTLLSTVLLGRVSSNKSDK